MKPEDLARIFEDAAIAVAPGVDVEPDAARDAAVLDFLADLLRSGDLVLPERAMAVLNDVWFSAGATPSTKVNIPKAMKLLYASLGIDPAQRDKPGR